MNAFSGSCIGVVMIVWAFGKKMTSAFLEKFCDTIFDRYILLNVVVGVVEQATLVRFVVRTCFRRKAEPLLRRCLKLVLAWILQARARLQRWQFVARV